MSIDGDCIVLGARKLCFNVNFNSEMFQVYEKSIDTLDTQKNPLFQHESSKWPLIASLLGNDYIKRIPNVGFATIFNKVLPKMATWNAQDAMNACNNNLRYKMSEEHHILLNKYMNLFAHAPILTEDNMLKPMNGTHINTQHWGEEIGFSMDPNDILPVSQVKYMKAKLFDGCSFTMKDGSALPSYKITTCGHAIKNISPETPVPDFSIIDFSVMPIRCCASVMLQCYVAAHIGYEDSKNREDLINLATKVHEYKNPTLEPEKVPMQIDAWSMQGVFLPSTESNWQHDGYYALLKQSVCK